VRVVQTVPLKDKVKVEAVQVVKVVQEVKEE
jgi:hypothetical protein